MNPRSRFAPTKGWLSAALLTSLLTACGGEPQVEEGVATEAPEAPAPQVEASPEDEQNVSAQVYYYPIGSAGSLSYSSWQQKTPQFNFFEISCGGVRLSYGASNVTYNRTVRARLYRSTNSGSTWTNVSVNGGRYYVDTTIGGLSSQTIQPMEPDVRVTHESWERWYVLLELLNRRTTDTGQGWQAFARCG
jgi:hypothetical protein